MTEEDGRLCPDPLPAISVASDQKSNCALILKNRPTVIDSGFRYVEVRRSWYVC